jgi:4-amino-4-deoxy-L-arabinose transferase-like glycosyltransferase
MSLLADKNFQPVHGQLAAKRSLSLIQLLAAGLIALLAFGLRLSFIGFPADRNADEPLVAALAKKAADSGRFTANWAGTMTGFYWDRPTYQFSPYTLLEESFHWVLYQTTGWPRTKEDHIYCARAVSCTWGALGVLVVFLATWKAFASLPAAYLAEAILALTPLHIEDSMFARVDAFVSFLVILCLYLVFLAMDKSGTLFQTTGQEEPEAKWRPGPWCMAAALVAGIAIAAKYNAAPVLLLVLWIPLAGWWRGRIGGPVACLQTIVIFAIAGAGFVIATPELVTDVQPLIEGMSFELGHYREGHIPFQALSWRDNNFFYWTWYLSRLGFGLLPLMAALLFLVNFKKSASLASAVLASYLVVAGILTILPRVRFERNLEVILGPLAIASALGFMIFHNRLIGRERPAVLHLTPICLVLFFAQPVRTLFDIRDLIRPESRITRYLDLEPGTSFYGDMMSIPNTQAKRFANVFLADYNDPFSASNRKRWFGLLGVNHETKVWHSKWSEHGYPFSSLDLMFGPARLYLVQRRGPGTRIQQR